MLVSKANSPITGFKPTDDHSIEFALRVLANANPFLSYKNKSEIENAISTIKLAINSTDAKSPEGKRLIHQICRHLCPNEAPSTYSAFKALLKIQTVASEMNVPFSPSTSSLFSDFLLSELSKKSQHAKKA